MKKWTLFLGILLLTACSHDPVEGEEEFWLAREGSTPAQIRPEEIPFSGGHEDVDFSNEILSTTEGIDIDLTQLSASMTYAIVFQMVFYPEEYVGKTVRMGGTFFVWLNPQNGKEYYATVVEDALACCEQGLEFILREGDYPSVGEYHVVTGELQLYQGDGFENIHLVNAVLS